MSSESTSAGVWPRARVARYSPGGKVTARKRNEARARTFGTYVVLAVGAGIMLLPVVWLLSTSLKPPDQVYAIPMVWIPRPFEFQRIIESATQRLTRPAVGM